MSHEEAAKLLGCCCGNIHSLLYRGKLKRTVDGVSATSVRQYLTTRRFRRKTTDTGVVSARHMPNELLRRFRAAVPGGSSFTKCLIEALELWLREEEK